MVYTGDYGFGDCQWANDLNCAGDDHLIAPGGVQLAHYHPGRIEFVPTQSASPDLAQRLGQRLHLWTGKRWSVSIVNDGGAETIAALRDKAENALWAQAKEHPLVQAVMAEFSGAKITQIRTQEEIAAEVEADALPEIDDEWDPFEQD